MSARAARDDRSASRRQPHAVRLQLLWLWVLVVVLYFAWEAATYRGLFAILAEWQFERLGQELPTFNFGLLAMLFAWPALILFRRRQLSPEEREQVLAEAGLPHQPAAADAVAQLREEGALAASAARDYMHFLFGFATALALATLAALAWTLFLPGGRGTPQRFQPDAAAFDTLHDGAARLEGGLRYGRIASFGRGIFFFRRTTLYAPIIPPPGDGREVRYFVEFLPAERAEVASGGSLSHRDGILVRRDLPGALVRLYTYLGYRTVPHYYVLYASPTTLRAPYLILAAQFALGALGFLFVGLWQRFHLARLPREVAQRERGIRARARRREASEAREA